MVEPAQRSALMKTVYVLMVEWSPGDFKDFSRHESYSAAEWAARRQRASGANCVIVTRTVADGAGTGGKGGSVGGIVLILILAGLYRYCTGPAKPPPAPAALQDHDGGSGSPGRERLKAKCAPDLHHKAKPDPNAKPFELPQPTEEP